MEVTVQQVKDIVSVLTQDEQQLLKDTIIHGAWGDSDMEFLDENGNIETVSMYGYCTNDAVKAGNFNNKRHEKMNRYERSAYDRFTTWRDKVLKRLNREKRLVGWEEVERLQEKLERLTELQEKMKAVNKIVRSKKLSEVEQYEELEALGLSKELINEVMSEPQYAFQKKGFQAYQISNNNAKIKATEEAIRRHTAMAETEDSEIPFEGGKIEMCYSEERIRIYFDERPDAEMIKKLKGAAFKWSPKNVAWQRQLTPNAKYATSRLLGVEI